MTTKKQQQKPKVPLLVIGIICLFLSSVLWIGAAVIPFTALSIGQKAMIITGLLIIAELLFWVGTVCVGKEFITKIKSLYSYKNWKARNDQPKP